MGIRKLTGGRRPAVTGLLWRLLSAGLLSLLVGTACFAGTVQLQWSPSTGTDVKGYRVYYKADSSVAPFNGAGAVEGASPLDVAGLTTATVTGLDPAHAYYFAVTAYNTAGVESPYSNIATLPELTPPTTSISYPANNATVNGTVSVTASASDNVGVARVEFYLNGALVATDTSTPYLYSWDTTALAPGTYTLASKAYDAAGNVGASGNVAVKVSNDVAAPTVSLTAPANNATVSGTLTLTASASDDVGVTRVEFYQDGALLSAGNLAPYSFGWNTLTVGNGSHTLSAKAYDASGKVGQSANVTVTVQNPVSDSTAPTVALAAPTSNQAVGGTVAVAVNASDNVGVSKVEFYVNGSLQATDSAAPYSFTWNTLTLANGGYTLSAKAYDAAGNVGQSGSVAVSVNNVPLSITTSSLTAARVGSAYSVQLAATGGKAPYSWSVASGSLPAGLSLNASNGVVSGTATASGVYSFSVRATDANGATAARSFSLAVKTNVAPLSSASASSQNTSTGQLASKAIDGVISGYPVDYTKEWATVRQLAGAWIQLKWSSSRVLDQIVLYDRPNLNDQVTAGTLTFSDGSSVAVGALANNGSATTVSFPAKTVTWVKFSVTKAQGQNVGLSEFQAIGY